MEFSTINNSSKFAPDRFFGLFKRAYRRSIIDTSEDIIRVVKESSVQGKNIPQMTASCTGSRHVHWTDWTRFLQGYFKPVPNNTSYHNFKFSKANAGVVTVKVYATSEEDVNILKIGVTVSSLKGHRPDAIVPTGLDPACQWYLYKQIRPFCTTNQAKDITCPLPSVSEPK